MGVEKLSISVDAELAASVRAAAHEQGVTVSSWLADAAAAEVRRRWLRSALEQVAAEDGALEADEGARLIAAARARSQVILGTAASGAA
jgi:hypothetical protein